MGGVGAVGMCWELLRGVDRVGGWWDGFDVSGRGWGLVEAVSRG